MMLSTQWGDECCFNIISSLTSAASLSPRSQPACGSSRLSQTLRDTFHTMRFRWYVISSTPLNQSFECYACFQYITLSIQWWSLFDFISSSSPDICGLSFSLCLNDICVVHNKIFISLINQFLFILLEITKKSKKKIQLFLFVFFKKRKASSNLLLKNPDDCFTVWPSRYPTPENRLKFLIWLRKSIRHLQNSIDIRSNGFALRCHCILFEEGIDKESRMNFEEDLKIDKNKTDSESNKKIAAAREKPMTAVP